MILPPPVALDLNGEVVYCGGCDRPFTLRAVGRIQLVAEARAT